MMSILMKIAIVLVLACYLFFVGYFFTRKIGNLLEDYHDTPQERKGEECDVMIFGDTELACGCESYLNAMGVNCSRMAVVEENVRRTAGNGCCVFALDDSDYENLVACGMLHGRDKRGRLYAVCNDWKNRNLYLENEITVLDRVGISAENLYEIVRKRNVTEYSQ